MKYCIAPILLTAHSESLPAVVHRYPILTHPPTHQISQRIKVGLVRVLQSLPRCHVFTESTNEYILGAFGGPKLGVEFEDHLVPVTFRRHLIVILSTELYDEAEEITHFKWREYWLGAMSALWDLGVAAFSLMAPLVVFVSGSSWMSYHYCFGIWFLFLRL